MKWLQPVLIVLLFSFWWQPTAAGQQLGSPSHPRPQKLSSVRFRYDGPWVYRNSVKRRNAVRGIDHARGNLLPVSRPIRLESGRQGTLRIEHHPCQPGERCEPGDCGCFGYDRFRLEIRNAHSQTLVTFDLWAAYGNFQCIPVDLVGGTGDELLILRQPNRGSPIFNYELIILKLEGNQLMELGRAEQVGEWYQCCCSIQRDNIIIAGPIGQRKLLLEREVRAESDCLDRFNGGKVQKNRSLHYSPLHRRYEQLD